MKPDKAREPKEGDRKEKILLILNPKAGRGRSVELLGEYIPELAYDGSPVTLYFTQSEGDLTDYVKKEGRAYDRIIAAGGDGTLNELATAYVEGGLENHLGYLPTGTTCDFANSVGIPLDMAEAAEAAKKGPDRDYDIGLMNEDKYFVYVASFGLFTDSSYDTPTGLKNALGKLAYVLNALKSLGDIKPLQLKVNNSGTIYEGKFLFGAVSNTMQMGGVLKMNPEDVNMSDGEFELLLVRHPENAKDVTTLASAILNQDYSSDLFVFTSCRKAIFEFEEETPWTLDGEFGGAYTKCSLEIKKKAWRLSH